MVDILGVGAAALDMIASVPHFPEPDEKVDAKQYTFLPGGVTANYVTGVARLGLFSAGFVGALGNDEAGNILLQDFKKEGVDTTLIKVKNTSSATNFILLTDDGDKAIIQSPFFMGTRLDIPQDIDMEYILNAKLIHTTCVHKEASDYIVQEARKNKGDEILISFDLEKQVISAHGKDQILKFLDYVDLLVPQKLGITELTGERYPADAAKVIMKKKRNLKLIAVTLGGEGCMITYRKGTNIQQKIFPAFKINPVDVTGAGDAFNAAFTVGFLKGWDYIKIAEVSNAAGALNCLKIGARTGMCSLQEVEDFVYTNR
ncbi:MAG: carbohydrate kinase family protein [Candidatus Lokiarchaeota archaeon]|nr:carbohydrate kinase family protein [Candidatus Lokiarchaeota archaeon]